MSELTFLRLDNSPLCGWSVSLSAHLSLLAVVTSAAVCTGVQGRPSDTALNSSGRMPRSGIDGSYGSSDTDREKGRCR